MSDEAPPRVHPGRDAARNGTVQRTAGRFVDVDEHVWPLFDKGQQQVEQTQLCRALLEQMADDLQAQSKTRCRARPTNRAGRRRAAASGCPDRRENCDSTSFS